MMTPVNDNLDDIELRICRLNDFPDHVFIAMNRPYAIYGADQDEAFAIALDIMHKSAPPPHELIIVEIDVSDLPKSSPKLKGRSPTPKEEKEWLETGKISGVLGWTTSAWTPSQIRSRLSPVS